MENKIKRRIFLGTLLGSLTLSPLVIRFFRPSKMKLGPNSYLAGFREKYEEALSFPREYNPIIIKELAAQSEEERNKVLQIHKRYWQNFSKLDEAEFDYSYRQCERDGTIIPNNWCIDAHIKMKYGYGMEVTGHNNIDGTPVHWVMNMDGEATLPAAQEMNLSSLMRSLFDACEARPDQIVFSNVTKSNIDLPENPYYKGNGKYDELCYIREPNPKVAPRIRKLHYNRHYFSRQTGMYECRMNQFIDENPQDPIYFDESVPLPSVHQGYRIYDYCMIDGIYLPTQIRQYYRGIITGEQLYSNYKIKLLL